MAALTTKTIIARNIPRTAPRRAANYIADNAFRTASYIRNVEGYLSGLGQGFVVQPGALERGKKSRPEDFSSPPVPKRSPWFDFFAPLVDAFGRRIAPGEGEDGEVIVVPQAPKPIGAGTIALIGGGGLLAALLLAKAVK